MKIFGDKLIDFKTKTLSLHLYVTLYLQFVFEDLHCSKNVNLKTQKFDYKNALKSESMGLLPAQVVDLFVIPHENCNFMCARFTRNQNHHRWTRQTSQRFRRTGLLTRRHIRNIFRKIYIFESLK